MSRGKRREAWGRLSSLLGMIHARTSFDSKEKPFEPLREWPSDLIHRSEIDEIMLAQLKSAPRVRDGKQLASMFGL